MHTAVAMVLDRSGSMSSILDDVVGGFNDFVEEQRKNQAEGDSQTYVVTQFDNEYEVLQNGVDLDDVMVLDKSNFVPRGGTALLDAMGRTMHNIDALLERDSSIDQVIMVVVTDGGENCSQEFTRDQVFALIKEREEGVWDFNFIGANQDAIAVGNTLGIGTNKCLTYEATAQGTRGMFKSMSCSVDNYRKGMSNDISHTVNDSTAE